MLKGSRTVPDLAYRVKGSLRGRAPKYFSQAGPGKAPVILLAGASLTWHFLRHLGVAISLAGHPVHVIPRLKRNVLPVADAARLVREYIEAHDLKQVVIVAHSKGGVVGKYLLAHHNHDKRIRQVIAIAPPFYGSRLAPLTKRLNLAELRPQSPLLQELHAQKDVNTRIVVILPGHDSIIMPHDTELTGARTIAMRSHGHHRVVFDQQVENIILRELETR